MCSNKLIPRLRFPEFTEEWHQSFLSEFATINPKSKELPNKFYYIDLESVNNGILDKINLINKNEAPSRAKRLLIKEDILFQTVRPYQKNNYYFNKEETNFVASTGYAQIRTKNIAQFLFYFILTSKFVNDVLIRCTGTSYPAINSNDLKKININFPSLKEQEKIASFLSKIDEKIELLNQKLNQMKQFKKGLMQQIFSQKLRFDGFTDEWDECYLKNLGDFYRGHSYNSSNVIESGLLVLRSNNIQNNRLTFNNEELQFVNKPCKPELNLIKGDIVICMSNGTKSLVGKSAKYEGNYKNDLTVGAFCSIFRSKSPLAEYIFQSNLFKKYMYILLAGTNINNLKNSDLEKMIIYIPKMKEQGKIANFLSKVDEKIDLIQSQLDQIEEFKRGLLQSMFV